MNPTPQTAIARPRWWNGKISQRIACEIGMIGPPPSPWRMRATISVVRSGAAPATKEVITHETSSSPADREPCRCVRMTLVTLVSRICMKATTMTVKVIAHFCTGEIGASGAGGVIAGVLLGVRPKVGEPLVVGHGKGVVARLAVRDRVRRHRYGELHRRETVGAQHERLLLAKYRRGEPWEATQTRSRGLRHVSSRSRRLSPVGRRALPCR